LSPGASGGCDLKEHVVNARAVAFCALVVTASPAAVQPAAAQYWSHPAGYDVISPYAIHSVLRAHGLRPIARPVQTGAYVVVRAVDPMGDVVRVLINAHYGNIVQVMPLPPAPVVGERPYRPYGPYASRPYPAEPRYGDVRPDLKSEPARVAPMAPAGPNDPNAGFNAPEPRSSQESRAAAMTPPRTPMPRPRPAAATAATAAAQPEAVPQPPSAAPAPPPAETRGEAPPADPADQAFPPAAPLE
jgi:hypothetical protein